MNYIWLNVVHVIWPYSLVGVSRLQWIWCSTTTISTVLQKGDFSLQPFAISTGAVFAIHTITRGVVLFSLELLGIGRCDVFGGFLLLESHSCGSKDEGGVGKELHVSEVFWYFLFVITIDLRLAFKYWKI